MLKDIKEVRVVEGYRIHLRFDDGVEGEIDLGEILTFEGVFEPLRDPLEFGKVYVDGGTICWPGGADLDPPVLYARVTGRSVSEFLDTAGS